MFRGLAISSNSATTTGTIKALNAWHCSRVLMLNTEEHRRCFGQFGEGKRNFTLAREISKKNFQKSYPEYVKRCKNKNSSISEKHKKEMFNVF